MEPFRIGFYQEDEFGKFRLHPYEFYSLDFLEKFINRRKKEMIETSPVITSVTKYALNELDELYEKGVKYFKKGEQA